MNREQILTKDIRAYQCCNRKKKKAVGALHTFLSRLKISHPLAKSIFAHRIPASIFPAMLNALCCESTAAWLLCHVITSSPINRKIKQQVLKVHQLTQRGQLPLHILRRQELGFPPSPDCKISQSCPGTVLQHLNWTTLSWVDRVTFTLQLLFSNDSK